MWLPSISIQCGHYEPQIPIFHENAPGCSIFKTSKTFCYWWRLESMIFWIVRMLSCVCFLKVLKLFIEMNWTFKTLAKGPIIMKISVEHPKMTQNNLSESVKHCDDQYVWSLSVWNLFVSKIKNRVFHNGTFSNFVLRMHRCLLPMVDWLWFFWWFLDVIFIAPEAIVFGHLLI